MTLKEINEFEILEDYKSDLKIEQIKAQMLADITVELVKKEQFVANQDIEMIAGRVRHLVSLVFKEGGDE